MAAAAQSHCETPLTIDPQLLEMLVCPVCKTPVQLEEDESGLFCTNCRRFYRIEDDIPVMLEEEATIRPDGPG